MSFWRPPQLPAVERMPKGRGKPGKAGEPGKRMFRRVVAGVGALALGLGAGVGVYQSLGDTSGGRSPVMALAAFLPVILLARYAFTGTLKL